jgi:hypothetical protein
MKFLIVALLMLIGAFANAQNVMLSVIGNQKGAPSELKLTELKSILKAERQRWRNGNKIIIALMKTNTTTGKYTCEKIYDMSPNELKKFWLALVFQGKADPPAFFDSVSELQAFVSENPGAIGIVDQPTAASGTQIVLIEGRKTF